LAAEAEKFINPTKPVNKQDIEMVRINFFMGQR
jgi:hypothetical protein